ADKNFLVVGNFHLDAGNGAADVAGLDRRARIVQGANGRSFGKAIGLQDGNAEHKKKLLRFRSKRSGAANESANVRAEALPDFAENESTAEIEPKAIEALWVILSLSAPGGGRFRVERANRRGAFSERFFHGAFDTFQQCRHVQEIVRRRE